MGEVALTVTPNAFSEPATVSTIWVPLTLRIPALPDASCYWVRVRTFAIKEAPPNQTTTTARLSFAAPAIGIDTMSYGYLPNELGDPVYRSRIYTERLETPPHIPVSTLGILNDNKLTARNITVWFAHNEIRATAYSQFQVWLYSSCDALPDDGGGGVDDGDDDDDPDKGSGIYRAIKVDSPRAFLHRGIGAAIRTNYIPDGSIAFTSGNHDVKWWKQFDYDRRAGMLLCLGRKTGSGVSAVCRSFDQGNSVQLTYAPECNSAILKNLSEHHKVLLWTEAEPASPSDPDSNGNVTLFVSDDDAETFTSEGSATFSGSPLQARLLGACYDPRDGGKVLLLVSQGAGFKVLRSSDFGRSWTQSATVSGNSGVLEYDSEKRLAVLLMEGAPPLPDDPNSNGDVTLYHSTDGSESFALVGTSTKSSVTLSAKLQGLTYDPRFGGELFLRCEDAGADKTYNSTDAGLTWKERIA